MSLRIVIFDDNKNIRDSITLLLQTVPEFEVAGSFSNVLDCIEDVRESKPDIVLMDIEMPGINGYQTTQQLRAIPQFKTLPVIAMTAHQSDEVRQRCQQAGMDALISKPIAADSLAQQLQQWLQR